MKLFLPGPSEEQLLQEISYLGRAITLADWMSAISLTALGINIGLLVGVLLFGKVSPPLALVGWVLTFLPMISFPFEDAIARRCKWIPEAKEKE